MKQIVPVVLCGGGGTRLWPRSRVAEPKPFLPLVGDNTLFEATVLRCADPVLFAPPLVVTGAQHVALVTAQLGDRPGSRVIVEPCGRNTAAAIALAALAVDPDNILLVCPSDHHIEDGDAFLRAARDAAALADQGWLVSIAIAATAPETGFGYLKRGEPIGDLGYRTARFVEKPDLERAQAFVAAGDYSWNGGIFAFSAGLFLSELERHRPDILASVRKAMDAGRADGSLFHPDADDFAGTPKESIDYAVMEKTDRAAMGTGAMGWSDIGNWEALREARQRDGQGNSLTGAAELIDCRNILVDTDGPRVSAIGLEDVIIVVDKGEILVMSAGHAQKVGQLSGALNQ